MAYSLVQPKQKKEEPYHKNQTAARIQLYQVIGLSIQSNSQQAAADVTVLTCKSLAAGCLPNLEKHLGALKLNSDFGLGGI